MSSDAEPGQWFSQLTTCKARLTPQSPAGSKYFKRLTPCATCADRRTALNRSCRFLGRGLPSTELNTLKLNAGLRRVLVDSCGTVQSVDFQDDRADTDLDIQPFFAHGYNRNLSVTDIAAMKVEYSLCSQPPHY